jgi:hypothetical protein
MGLKEEKAFLIFACVTPVNSFLWCIGSAGSRKTRQTLCCGREYKERFSECKDLFI